MRTPKPAAESVHSLSGRALTPADDRFSDSDHLAAFCLGRLRRLASRMLSQYTKSRRQEDTDDLLQNAALRMHRACSEVVINSPEHAVALAVTQIKRELVDMIRRLQRQPSVEPITPGNEPVGYVEHLASWEAFHDAVRQLPDGQREAVHFLWYLGLDQEQAAGMLGISSRTLRRDWRLARDCLRRRFDDLDFVG